MKFYFSLQYRRILRWLEKQGLPAFLGLSMAFILFGILSYLLFQRTQYAPYIFTGIAIYIIFLLSQKKRNELLKMHFTGVKYMKIRLAENMLLASSFIAVLLIQFYFFHALSLLFFATILSLYRNNRLVKTTIWTPFRKFPFEYIVGFRKVFWLFPVIYFVLYKSIEIGNYPLGVFACLMSIALCYSFYSWPEQEYFVWIYSKNVNAFLMHKLGLASLLSIFIYLPCTIILTIAFPHYVVINMAIILFAHISISVVVLAKYSAFPREMNLPQSILLGLSILFPPLIILTCFIFYKQSIRQLEKIL